MAWLVASAPARADEAARADRAAQDATPVRVVGPLATKELSEALATAFAETEGPLTLRYLRIERPSAAAGALLAGRDLWVSLGSVRDDDLGSAARRWKRLGAQSHVFAARATAVVVHLRNPIESLTIEQIRSVFGGKVRDWESLAGLRKPIRRYGLTIADPLATLFHERVLPTMKCRTILRKRTSAEVLTALAADPSGIAFTDAAAVAATNAPVKVIGIGEGDAAIAPNAQTLKDGSYPLGEVVVLHVSPRASSTAQAFARFVLGDKADAICRCHGCIPTLRPIKANALAAFQKLYGPDLQRVAATPSPQDDLRLAAELLATARNAEIEAPLSEAMCEAVHDLATLHPDGDGTVLAALDLLETRAPQRRFDCGLKRAALYERAYTAAPSIATAEPLIETWMAAAEAGAAAHRFEESAEVWRRALAVAEQVDSASATAIRKRLPTFEARVESVAAAQKLAALLRSDPANPKLRRQMLEVQLLELDDPAEAARYVDAAEDESMRTYVPLAAGPIEKLTEDGALALAEWYVRLSSRAKPGGRDLLAGRARACYRRFFELHPARDDVAALRATLGMQKVGGEVPAPAEPPTPVAAGHPKRDREAPKPKVELEDGEEITDRKLAAFVAANPTMVHLTRKQIGAARQITDLRCLQRLANLEVLELQHAKNVKDLSPLARLRSLRTLTLTGLRVKGLSDLSGLPRLTSLKIIGARDVSDIAPIARLRALRRLDLCACVHVSDLRPLARLTCLGSLNLTNSSGITDVAPLAVLSKTLTSLNLSGTRVSDLTPLVRLTRLRSLDLRRCRGVSSDDVQRLEERLPDCKVVWEPQTSRLRSTNPNVR